MAKSANLLMLVGALMRDEDVRRRFNEKPKRVMKQYKLTSDDRDVLWAMDPAKIVSSVNGLIADLKQEITHAANQMDPDEFPPIDDDYVETSGPLYPDPKPAVFRVRPRKIELPAATHPSVCESFEIKLFGQSFSRDPEATVEVTGAQQMLAEAAVLGTFRCSRMCVVVRVQAGGIVPAGDYTVTLVNCPGGTNEERLSVGIVKVEHV